MILPLQRLCFVAHLLLFPQLMLLSDAFHVTTQNVRPKRRMTQLDVDFSGMDTKQKNEQVVRAPIKYIGSYPCLGLRFPLLTTSNQRKSQKNITGLSLDFMIDTAANLNVIQPAIVSELQLPPVTSQVLPGFTSSGRIDATNPAMEGISNTFILGDSQLEYYVNINDTVVATPTAQSQSDLDHTFMTQLTASVIPNVACPTAGILSLAFLQVFGGGVDFSWGTAPSINQPQAQIGSSIPSVSFLGDKSLDNIVLKGRQKVSLSRIPVTQLLSIPIKINGVTVMALLDTGSPITVLHPDIAKLLNVNTVLPVTTSDQKSNPLSSISSRMQEAQASSRGDLLAIMGSDGKKVNLIKSKEPIHITMPSSSAANTKDIDFGATSIFVGEFPGLTMMMQQQRYDVKASTDATSVGVILGMDVLRQRPSMLLRAQDNEVYF